MQMDELQNTIENMMELRHNFNEEVDRRLQQNQTKWTNLLLEDFCTILAGIFEKLKTLEMKVDGQCFFIYFDSLKSIK